MTSWSSGSPGTSFFTLREECVRTTGGCATLQAELGVIAGVNLCLVGDDLQLSVQLGRSSGVGADAGFTSIVSDATSPRQLAGFGVGFGGSVSPGLSFGVDRCYSKSGGTTINCLTAFTGAGLELSPEASLPGEAHAHGSLTLDLNHLLAICFGIRSIAV